MIPPYRRRPWAPLLTPLAPALAAALTTLLAVITATINHLGDGWRLAITATGLCISAALVRAAARRKDWLLHAWIARSAAASTRWRTDLLTITATITITAMFAAATAPSLATAGWVIVIFTAVTAGTLYRLPSEYDPTIHQWGNIVHIADNPIPGWAHSILNGDWDPTAKLHALMASYDTEPTAAPSRATANPRSEHGFTLVETIISLMLVATGATTIAMTATGSLNLTRVTNINITAHEQTNTNLAQTFQVDYINLTHPKNATSGGMIDSTQLPANLSTATGERLRGLKNPIPIHTQITIPLLGEGHQYTLITCGNPSSNEDTTAACVDSGKKTITSVIAWKQEGATCTIPTLAGLVNQGVWAGWACQVAAGQRIDEFAQRPTGTPQLTYVASGEAFTCPDLNTTGGAICSITMPTGILKENADDDLVIPIEVVTNQNGVEPSIEPGSMTGSFDTTLTQENGDFTVTQLSNQGGGNIWAGSVVILKTEGNLSASGSRSESKAQALTVTVTLSFKTEGQEKSVTRIGQYWLPQ